MLDDPTLHVLHKTSGSLPKTKEKSKREIVHEIVERSAEEHRYVAADVVQAIITCVDILVIAYAGQRDQDYDEARLHDEPGQGGMRGRVRGRGKG